MSATDPVTVLRAFDAALNAHNLEAALGLFAEGATVRYEPAPPRPAPATYTGLADIRALLAELIAQNVAVEAEDYRAEGERVICPERRMFAARHEEMGGNPVVVTCDAVIREDRIEEMTIIFSPESLRRMQAALAGRG